MASIYRWVLSDKDGVEEDYEYADFDEAKAEARRRRVAVIEREYEYSDSYIAATPNGETEWPPSHD